MQKTAFDTKYNPVPLEVYKILFNFKFNHIGSALNPLMKVKKHAQQAFFTQLSPSGCSFVDILVVKLTYLNLKEQKAADKITTRSRKYIYLPAKT